MRNVGALAEFVVSHGAAAEWRSTRPFASFRAFLCSAAVIAIAVFLCGCSKEPPAPKEPATGNVQPRAIAGFTHTGKNEQGCDEYRHDQTGMVFVLIPGGTFQMGSNDGEYDEKPVHEVALDSFLISKYEVTQAVWQKVMDNNPSNFKGAESPVEQLSWNDCQEFCKKTGLRLPTEAEWEQACRAGTTTRYYWGNERSGEHMWFDRNARSTTHPVGAKLPNRFGLHDMSGNVWEWCADWHAENYYKDSPRHSPKGSGSGQYRVVRGGSWGNLAMDCRSCFRCRREPTYRNDDLGFRCAHDSR